MTLQITILGLEEIGASFGLALAEHKTEITRTGWDRKVEHTQQSQKLGAVDKIAHNLHRAVEGADVVILSVPMDEVEFTLKEIAPDLKEGSILLNAAGAMVTVSKWMQELLPPKRLYATLFPTINPTYLLDVSFGVTSARADKFVGGLIVITTLPGMDPQAVDQAAYLARLVGATTLFGDMYEFDGLEASADLLPRLTAAALVNATAGNPGWREGAKLTGQAYSLTSEPLEMQDPKTLAGMALNNSENAVRVLDNLVIQLQAFRRLIVEKDEETLTGLLKRANEARHAWWKQRMKGDWEYRPEMPKLPSAGESMGRMIFGAFGKDRKEK